MFLWILLANFFGSVFYLVYRYIVRSKMNPVQNRIFILALVTLSLVLAVIPHVFSVSGNVAVFSLPEIDLYELSQHHARFSGSLSGNALVAVYLIGSAIALLAFLVSLVKILQMVRKGDKEAGQGYVLTLNRQVKSPFTFFNRIVMNPEDRENLLIFNHELAHARQWHTLDILFVRLVAILFWFNPIWFLWIRQMRIQHEFLADDHALQTEDDPVKYIESLLNGAMEMPVLKLVNQAFAPSMVFQRIHRIQSKEKIRGKWTGWMAVMVVLFISAGFAGFVPEGSFTFSETIQPKKLEVMPSYKGGSGKMAEVLGKNLDMEAISERIENDQTAYVSILINKFGAVEDVALVRGFDDETDDLILKAVYSLNDWNPGRANGKAVATRIILPIRLKWE